MIDKSRLVTLLCCINNKIFINSEEVTTPDSVSGISLLSTVHDMVIILL